jgi:hypothetical protein
MRHGRKPKAYAGTYVGIAAIIAGVFHRLGTEWIGYRAEAHTFLADGDRVAAFGVYSGTYEATAGSPRPVPCLKQSTLAFVKYISVCELY